MLALKKKIAKTFVDNDLSAPEYILRKSLSSLFRVGKEVNMNIRHVMNEQR